MNIIVVSLLNTFLFQFFPIRGWFYGLYLLLEEYTSHITIVLSFLCSGIQAQTTFLLGVNRLLSVRVVNDKVTFLLNR